MSDIGFRLTGDNSQFRGMLEQSQNVLSKFNGYLGTIGVGVSVAGIVSFFQKVAAQTGALQDLSERLDVGTDALQSFAYQAKLAGASSEQATQVWEKTKKSVDALAAGDAAAGKLFARIGLAAKDFVGLNLEQSLETIARAYSENAREAGAYDAVTDILGSKSAPKLNAVLLQLGSEGFPAFNEAARKSGQLIEDHTIKSIDFLSDQLDIYKGKLTTTAAKTIEWGMALALLPQAVSAFVEKSTGIDLPWVNLEKQAQKAVQTMQATLPPVQQMTKEGEKQILQDLEKSRLGDEQLDRGKRLSLLKADLVTIEEALSKSGLTQYEIDGLRLMQAETKKLIKTDEKQLDADAKKHAERMEEMTAKEIEDAREKLTTEEQIAALKTEEAGWIAVMDDKTINIAANQNAEYQLAIVRSKLREVEAKQAKELADIEAGRSITNTSYTRDQLTQLKIQEKQGLIKQAEAEATEIQRGKVNGLTTAEVERLNVLNQQSQELENQIRLALQYSSITRVGKGYDQQSDDSLTGVQNRLKTQIEQLKRDSFGKSWGVGGTGKTPELYLLESELYNLQQEIKQRDEVRDYATKYGEEKTRQKYGDTLTDRGLRDLTDRTEKTGLAIDDIQQRLKNLFPDVR